MHGHTSNTLYLFQTFRHVYSVSFVVVPDRTFSSNIEKISGDHSEPTRSVTLSLPGNRCVIIPRALDKETKEYVCSTGSLEAGLSGINVK